MEVRNIMVEPGQKYRHFKGGIYEIICIGAHSETQEKMVVYKEIGSEKICIRPYDMFISEVDKEKYPNVNQKYRFELYDPKKVKVKKVKMKDIFPKKRVKIRRRHSYHPSIIVEVFHHE